MASSCGCLIKPLQEDYFRIGQTSSSRTGRTSGLPFCSVTANLACLLSGGAAEGPKAELMPIAFYMDQLELIAKAGEPADLMNQVIFLPFGK
ncbi:MAG TPA: hypothetical protein VGX03_13330 [Candidatus Binatia bacterium]|jgi:hypothetical protein|nr:hypothetical protein [Candidatus Binatia bacterium]